MKRDVDKRDVCMYCFEMEGSIVNDTDVTKPKSSKSQEEALAGSGGT
jgi:hypothetical protein